MPKGKPLSLVGRRFGRWTVLAKAEADESGKTMWTCDCDCGRTVVVQGQNLTSGRSKGCRTCYLERVRVG